MRVRTTAFLALATCFMLSLPAQSENYPLDRELPAIEVMEGMHTEWAAKHMRYNGVPMTIRTFTSPESIDTIFSHYERLWKTRHVGETVRTRYQSTETLGFRANDAFFTLQAQTSGNVTSGALVVTGIVEQYDHQLETDFPLPGNMEVVTRIEAIDRGRLSETLSVTSERDAGTVERSVVSALESSGWVLQTTNSFERETPKVLSLQRGPELCQLTLVDGDFEQPTTLLVHWIKQ